MKGINNKRFFVLLPSVIIGVLAVVGVVSAATTIGTDISTDGSLSVTGLPEGSIPYIGNGGTFGASADLAHDTTTPDFVINANGFAILTARGTYTGTGSTDSLSGENIEVLLTPTANTQNLVASQGAVGSQGSGDLDHLMGSNFNAYALGTGHVNKINAYVADAEMVGVGTADEIDDFKAYGIYSPAGSSITNAWHFYAGTGGIAGTITNLYGVGIESPSVSGSVTNAYQLWAGDLAGVATNSYYSWFDSRGVRRVKEDSTFNGVGQAIEALYNPQFTKYTPGATDYERIVLGQWSSNTAQIGTEAGGSGTLRPLQLIGNGVGIGTSTPIANFQATTASSNATTTMEVGKANQNKGSCLKLYRTDGTAIYAYVAAGATTLTLSTSACASVTNF